jgi:hypothetical protein
MRTHSPNPAVLVGEGTGAPDGLAISLGWSLVLARVLPARGTVLAHRRAHREKAR